MPDLRKGGKHAEPALGTVNTDLTKVTARSDPRFYPDPAPAETPGEAATGGLAILGGRLSVSKQTLPAHPAGWPHNDSPIKLGGT